MTPGLSEVNFALLYLSGPSGTARVPFKGKLFLTGTKIYLLITTPSALILFLFDPLQTWIMTLHPINCNLLR